MSEGNLEEQISNAPHRLNQTGRLTVPAAEAVLHKNFQCLDHGFIRLVDYMGGDDAIVQAARVSYGAGTKQVSEDKGLIRYLMRNRHTTPFEMVELKFHMGMPIFVARQWIRHRTASVNEYSARYSVMPDTFYRPKIEDVREQSKGNKQGGDEPVNVSTAQDFLDFLQEGEERYSKYKGLVDAGVAREIARIGLPQSIYTQWYWKIDLHNLLHFLSLRMDPHAQKEIREYASTMANEIVKPVAPHAFEAFRDYRLNAQTFSDTDRRAYQQILSGTSREEAALTIENKREREEFLKKVEWLYKKS